MKTLLLKVKNEEIFRLPFDFTLNAFCCQYFLKKIIRPNTSRDLCMELEQQLNVTHFLKKITTYDSVQQQ